MDQLFVNDKFKDNILVKYILTGIIGSNHPSIGLKIEIQHIINLFIILKIKIV